MRVLCEYYIRTLAYSLRHTDLGQIFGFSYTTYTSVLMVWYPKMSFYFGTTKMNFYNQCNSDGSTKEAVIVKQLDKIGRNLLNLYSYVQNLYYEISRYVGSGNYNNYKSFCIDFQTYFKALSYEEKYGIDLDEFFNSTIGIFKTEPFSTWDADIRAKRQPKTNESQQ